MQNGINDAKRLVYYYEELEMSRINAVINALESRMESGIAELTLKNGIELLVGRKPNGDIQIYDGELNLIAEFDNTGYNEYCSGYAMFNAAVFIIRTSRKSEFL